MSKFVQGFKKIIYGYIPFYYAKTFNPHSASLPYYKYVIDYHNAHHLFLFRHEYEDMEVYVEVDQESGLPYVFLPDSQKKLFFSKRMTHEAIKKLYITLLMEQDPRSPHRYFDQIEEFKGKTLLDVGAAEGILSLMAIEQVNHVYLFECAEDWIDALTKTFEPWKEKITIVRKYVSDKNDDNHVTLDTFFKDHPQQNLFLKMDIEGMERLALAGCRQLFATPGNVCFAICTYHRKDDLSVISSFLNTFHCKYTNQTGFFAHRLKSILLRGFN
ncbi:MAG: FkbM family methyltransferase [Prevotella sp.]|nr:FkbM family methyltransferase [Prevotella sp.]